MCGLKPSGGLCTACWAIIFITQHMWPNFGGTTLASSTVNSGGTRPPPLPWCLRLWCILQDRISSAPVATGYGILQSGVRGTLAAPAFWLWNNYRSVVSWGLNIIYESTEMPSVFALQHEIQNSSSWLSICKHIAWRLELRPLGLHPLWNKSYGCRCTWHTSTYTGVGSRRFKFCLLSVFSIFCTNY